MSLAEVLEVALRLSHEDRAKLAQKMLHSLEPVEQESPDEEWEAAVSKRLSERIDRYERGETAARDWREVMDEIDAELDEETAR